MEFLHNPHQLHHFLFMGCWNKDGCTQSPGQKAVARALQQEPSNWPLFLGGDNIYPDKHEKKKTYPPKRVEEGVACLLRKTLRPIYATIGNHNIARPDVLEAEVALESWILKPHSYGVQFKDRAVLFLNSNPFDESELGKEGEDVLEALDTALVHLQKTGTPYILIMHHPIIALKKGAYYLMPHHAPLLDRLITYPPQLMLVADTHNYQLGTIEWKGVGIRQVIVGTGGADLDPIPTEPVEFTDFKGAYYVEDAKVAHGYLRVTGTATEFVEPRTSPRSSRSSSQSSRKSKKSPKGSGKSTRKRR